jgi:hypothetical protein
VDVESSSLFARSIFRASFGRLFLLMGRQLAVGLWR